MKISILPIFSWAFIITILWIGFILAISFFETPLKFYALLLTVPAAIQIEYVLFHALNLVEIIFAAVVIGAAYCGEGSKKTTSLTISIAILLTIQTAFLFFLLDPKTLAMVHGIEAMTSPYHIVHMVIAGQIIRMITLPAHHIMYIIIELVKVVLLVALAFSQIQDLRDKINQIIKDEIEKASHSAW
ncbi:hypothetical protein [Candidatus Nitrosacidococcus tergens]|uniref:Uncharacterized protein n=1 Tax=Candidatus Nitrosacidococcus tergens TaxID=553981 RepID=A0A7G1QBB2_9GAMM|nr:hypothetical protein [Candidatus Nitrosacidococcus tergens]CAB1277276.1 conserved membrane protein of unknown function [Candidatus Nitrosacidococcus tergens]